MSAGSSPRPAVFFDRDGTLIDAPIVDGRPRAVRDVGSITLVRGARQVCGELEELGVPLFVVTNQPDVARGLTTQYVVEQIDGAVVQALRITDLAVCWADDDDDPRRKPNPGLILELAERHGIDLARSVTVGDRWRDIEAGRRAGTKTVFVDRDYDEQQPDAPDLVVRELDEALDWIREQLGV
ncbi:MAG: HAD-IIIA family hydrolase [Patulibacter minatonensis]